MTSIRQQRLTAGRHAPVRRYTRVVDQGVGIYARTVEHDDPIRRKFETDFKLVFVNIESHFTILQTANTHVCAHAHMHACKFTWHFCMQLNCHHT